MKIAIFTLIIFISSHAKAVELSDDYRTVLLKYAEAALIEFDIIAKQSLSINVSSAKATIASGTDKVGRKFYVVLYPSKHGSVYVALEVSKDGYLEIHSRGGSLVSPKDFSSNFNKHISKVVHYPGAT
jgi:hypothetical protein